MNAEPITVVIADDHAPMRGKVREALEAGGCVVRGEAATAEQAVALVQQHAPDVALLDIHMPGSGIQAAREIVGSLPDTVVVMLTQSGEDDDLFDSVRAGASGYLLKDTDPAELPAALRGVLSGEAPMSPRLVARILSEFQTPKGRFSLRRPSAAARLSPREWEVMGLLADGRSTQEVAQQLFLSPTTVRVHVSTVLRKLRVKDRDSAFRLLRDE
ncbi:MAG TPA: response regulator transcription factor [Nocardioides sp.]|uniref:response regulator transcription factor n=1 Tax=Nocardioides sp. TaxID=35761 RepID=UPI002F3FD1FE